MQQSRAAGHRGNHPQRDERRGACTAPLLILDGAALGRVGLASRAFHPPYPCPGPSCGHPSETSRLDAGVWPHANANPSTSFTWMLAAVLSSGLAADAISMRRAPSPPLPAVHNHESAVRSVKLSVQCRAEARQILLHWSILLAIESAGRLFCGC